MNRRRFLAGGIAGMASVVGCVGRGPGSGGPATGSETPSAEETTMTANDSTTARTTERATTATDPRTTEGPSPRTETPAETSEREDTDTIRRRVSLVSVDDVPAKYRVSIDVELLESTATAAHTARLRVTTTNEGPKRRVSVWSGKCDIFNRTKGESEPSGLWLHRPESAEHIERDGDRWTRDRGPNDPPLGVAAYGCGDPVYTTDESVTTEYLVWDDFRAEGYMRPGTYRFEVKVYLYGPNADFESASKTEFTWGFSLAVETA